MSEPVITLLSDFGTRDGYVGAMKAELLVRCPAARLVDLSHEIEPGDVASAAWVLAQAAPRFPEGTVHLAVVDPGVGTGRRALACEIDGRIYVAPDNGLLDRVRTGATRIAARALGNAALWNTPVSAVFHGRDIFAPVAGSLAAGVPFASVGDALDPATLVSLEQDPPGWRDGALHGQVIHVDRFGNLVSDLALTPDEAVGGRVTIAGRDLEVHVTYGEAEPDELLALVGSEGYLEVASNGGDAAGRLGAGRGHVIVFRPRPRS